MDFSSITYTRVEGQEFAGQTVEVDGNYYTGCDFEGAEIVFRGEAPFGYASCRLDNVRIRLEGPARMVMAVLAGLLTPEDLVALSQLALSDVALPKRPN